MDVLPSAPVPEPESAPAEPKKKKGRRRKVAAVLGIVLSIVGLAVAGGTAALMAPNWASESEIYDAASQFKFDDGVSDTSVDGTEGAATDNSNVDWERLSDFQEDARMWIEVDGKDIDFPVLQGDDNEYYLYHDIYGRRTYCSVFADYRADRNGRHVIIYGHTLIGGGMFTPLSRMSHQQDFNTMGEVYYSTPESGKRTYTPVASTSVTPDYQGVQQFEWEPDAVRIQEQYDMILKEKKAAGEANTEVESSAEMDPATSTFVRFSTDRKSSKSYYYCLTDEDKEKAYTAAEREAYREWLYRTVKDYPAKRSDWVDLVRQADESVVLACCSWPFNNHRTLIVCVRSDWESNNG